MITIKDLNKSFGTNQILKNVSLTIEEGEIFGIVGHSGAGKSTLLRCINGLESYDSGSVQFLGKELKELSSKEARLLKKDLGIIFQGFNLMNSKNVYENIAFPLKLWGYPKEYIAEKVSSLLNLVELEDKAKSKIKNLSGGQKQRVAIARALSLDPKVLLCDEATSALDPKTTKSILKLLNDINSKINITIIMVTHEMEVVKELCTKVSLMDGGEVKYCGTVKNMFLSSENTLDSLILEEELLPKEGVNIKLFFSDSTCDKAIITNIARSLDINISIVWGRLERFRDEVLGILIINVEKKYLTKLEEKLELENIYFKVLKKVERSDTYDN